MNPTAASSLPRKVRAAGCGCLQRYASTKPARSPTGWGGACPVPRPRAGPLTAACLVSSVPPQCRAGGVGVPHRLHSTLRLFRVLRPAASQSKPVAMAFASWWYKTVNGSDRAWAGPGRKCVWFEFLGVRIKCCPGFLGKGRGPGATYCQTFRLGFGRGQTHPTVVCVSAPGLVCRCERMRQAQLGLSVEWNRNCCWRNSDSGYEFLDQLGLIS